MDAMEEIKATIFSSNREEINAIVELIKIRKEMLSKEKMNEMKVGDKVSIGNIVGIDINENRKLMTNYFTVLFVNIVGEGGFDNSIVVDSFAFFFLCQSNSINRCNRMLEKGL